MSLNVLEICIVGNTNLNAEKVCAIKIAKQQS